MWAEVVVRRARRADDARRAKLVTEGFADSLKDAFFYFLFQELTAQFCVLAGAVLFIFCGSAPLSCALVLPGAALLVAAAVYLTHVAVSTKHVEDMRSELLGFVAEARGVRGERGSPGGGCPLAIPVRILQDEDSDAEYFHYNRQVVGTVSVSRCRTPHRAAWLHDLALCRRWRGRGVARALEEAARRASVAMRLDSMETVTSELQHAARALLHAQGWELRGTYQRSVLWSAVTLPMAHLGIDLPLYA